MAAEGNVYQAWFQRQYGLIFRFKLPVQNFAHRLFCGIGAKRFDRAVLVNEEIAATPQR
jgi:hypothetical protein